MAMNVGDWYADPAQRYNDVINPQKDRVRREKDVKTSGTQKADNTQTKELSPAAQKLLEKLKKQYGNVDFMVAGSDRSAEAKAKLAGGTKEYSVLFTNEELEKMASDSKYENLMKSRMQEGFQAVAKESAKFGLDGIDPVTKGTVKSVSVLCDANGVSSVRKEMENPADAQKTRIEEQREKKAVEKKAAEKKAAEKKAAEKKEAQKKRSV